MEIKMDAVKEDLIRERYYQALERIEKTARRAGRDPSEVRLVVVTKGHPVHHVQAVIEAGAKILGENYAEEAVEKIDGLSREYPPGVLVEWHMIGHVQSRKAKLVSEHFSYLHSLDSVKLAHRLDRFSGDAGRKLPVLLECNVSGEASKYGLPAFDEREWDHLLPQIEEILALPHLQVRGLMTMAPFLPAAEDARPYFRRLRQLLEYLRAKFPGADWQELSMGMSADFEPAIEEGATLVRIGTAIMGERPAR